MPIGFESHKSGHVPHSKTDLYEIIKQEVEDSFGRGIATSRDCLQLSEEIYHKTSFRISSNTLRRFFGLVKAQYLPSVATLNILSNYCGYASPEELSAIKRHKVTKAESETKGVLRYLVALFTAMPLKDATEEAFYTYLKHTITFLSQQPELAGKFQRAIVKTRNGQEYYFEQFLNFDKLNAFYGEGLRYYISEKKAAESQTFGYAVLCIKDWLNNDLDSLKDNYRYVRRVGLPKQAAPYFHAYCFTAHLLYAEAFGLDVNKILEDAYHFYVKSKANRSGYPLHQSFEYIIVSALVLTHHYKDALYYINEALVNHPVRYSQMDQGCFRRLTLFKALAFAQSGITDEAERVFEQVKPSQFHFLSKKLDSILYLVLAKEFKRTNEKLEIQLEDLLNATGFFRLKAFKVSTSRKTRPAKHAGSK